MVWKPVEVIRVQAWGRDVGALAPGGRAYVFEYEPSWLRSGIELAPSLMPLPRRRGVTFSFPELPWATFQGLPPMLADAVPDRFGNSLIAAALAREGVQPADVTPLDRMAYLGARTMGALTFHPNRSPQHESSAIELKEIVEAARRAVRGDLGAEDTRTHAVNQLITVGASAGGARAKAVLAWNRKTGEIRAGNLAAEPGFEEWLMKFDGLGEDLQLGTGQEYGRTEYAYYLMAQEAGIDMADSRLLEEGGRAHFVTRRFDRPGTDGQRLHLQSLCALEGLDFNGIDTNEYASYLLAVNRLVPASAQEAFRRMVFNVLASNNDDHTKNFSFLMDEQGVWSLAPAYDITFAYNPRGEWTRRHLMGVQGNFDIPTVREMQALADRFQIPAVGDVIDRVADAVQQWSRFAAEAGVGADRTAEIENRLREVRSAAFSGVSWRR